MSFWMREATLQIGGKVYGMDDLYFEFEVPFEDSDTIQSATFKAYTIGQHLAGVGDAQVHSKELPDVVVADGEGIGPVGQLHAEGIGDLGGVHVDVLHLGPPMTPPTARASRLLLP